MARLMMTLGSQQRIIMIIADANAVLILSHATTIKTKYQAMLHVGPVSQTCAIIDVDRPFIRTGDRATVAFRFIQRPEYLAPGDRLLFREGRTKGLGIVKSVGYDPNHPLMPDSENGNAGVNAGSSAAAAAAEVGGTKAANDGSENKENGRAGPSSGAGVRIGA